MITRQAVWTAVVAVAIHLAAGQEFQRTVRECDNSPGTIGYSSITDMNVDIEREIELLASGKKPDSAYLFILCPETEIDVGDTSLTPMLDNSIFACGENGKPKGCVFKGGKIQVNIPRSVEGGHNMQSVSFMGVSFQGFSHAAISGDAGSTTEVTLSHVEFSVSCSIDYALVSFSLLTASSFRIITLCVRSNSKPKMESSPSV